MTTQNRASRRPGERFRTWLERVLPLIYERQTQEMTDIAGLQADADTLAAVIPELATQLGTKTAALEKSEADLKTAIEAEEAGSAARVKMEGELAQVEAIKLELDPITAQAQTLVTPPAAAPADGGAAVGDPGAGAADPGAGGAAPGAGGV